MKAESLVRKLQEEYALNDALMPSLRKETNRTSMLALIGSAIVAVRSIVMHKTQQITRLRAVSEALFNNEIFGSAATEKVLKEINRDYARKFLFLPWKVLKALKMAINGGINYTGLEALRKVEGLEEFERGFLQSRGPVQRCAAELHEFGQTVIPVRKVASGVGEAFEFEYEKMLRYLL